MSVLNLAPENILLGLRRLIPHNGGGKTYPPPIKLADGVALNELHDAVSGLFHGIIHQLYVNPLSAGIIEAIIVTIRQRPRGEELLVARNFNADLAVPEGNARDKEIDAALAAAGLEDMSANFLPRRKLWLRDGRTRRILHGGREVRSRTDYILETDRRLLQNVLVR